ncbi:uncharacterized protein BKA78DRAFT_78572 [Phyllosticta capitalensis]|uniref:uncharacterized protein n=1 Tax=Phyllosticta capitalensis TaxID=121624 RepID=UPI0031302E74
MSIKSFITWLYTTTSSSSSIPYIIRSTAFSPPLFSYSCSLPSLYLAILFYSSFYYSYHFGAHRHT